MPTYDYICDKCETTVEISHSIKSEEKYFCEKCKSEMHRVPVLPFYVINKEGGYADHKEEEAKKKHYDKDRARKKRVKEFGSDAVGVPCETPDKKHIIKRGRTLGGSEKIVDRKDYIKAMAKDPLAVARASEALKKAENKKK